MSVNTDRDMLIDSHKGRRNSVMEMANSRNERLMLSSFSVFGRHTFSCVVYIFAEVQRCVFIKLCHHEKKLFFYNLKIECR